MMTAEKINSFENAAKLLALLAIFALPISTALVTISVILFLICWLISGNFKARFEIIRSNETAIWPLVLLAFFLIGTSYSTASWDDQAEILRKYAKLLFIPLAISIFTLHRWQKYVLISYMAAVLIVLILSYSKLLGLLPLGPYRDEYSVFKGRIGHGTLLSFAFYIAVYFAVHNARWRWYLLGLSALIFYNVFMMNGGRTGQVLILSLLVLLAFQHYGKKGLATGMVLISTVVIVLFTFSDRMVDLYKEIPAYQKGELKSPVGDRLPFYKNTLEIISERPIIGHGTGSFKQNYKQKAEKYHLTNITPNPHNEYMMIASQLGAVGLSLLLFMWYRQWRNDGVERSNQHLIQAVLTMMIIGSTVNSFLLDFTEGWFYALFIGVLGTKKS